jgi:benzoyl-CoA reductase/2-hydroxyglutaryl-CoA dehydratase subunit BcrC/BadD/HgdB
MQEVRQLRKENPPLISGYEAWQAEYSSLLIPKDEHNRLMKKYLRELKEAKKPRGGVRLFLSASAMDAENALLYKIIEESNGQVVSEDISCGSSYYGTTLDIIKPPLEAIAERCLHVHCPRSTTEEPIPNHRFEFIKESLKGYNVQGIIFFILNYCECRSLEYPRLADKLRRELGLPILFLEGDYTREGLEQLRPRVKTFIEMIKG